MLMRHAAPSFGAALVVAPLLVATLLFLRATREHRRVVHATVACVLVCSAAAPVLVFANEATLFAAAMGALDAPTHGPKDEIFRCLFFIVIVAIPPLTVGFLVYWLERAVYAFLNWDAARAKQA